MNRKNNCRAGFTLIEVLLVMVIIAILASVVVPKFTKRSQQAKETAAQSDIANLELALDSFEIDTGRYPTNTEGIKALVKEPVNTQDDWKGPYLKRGVPTDPWGNEYNFKQPGQYNENGYDLWSSGPDGVSGNDDDIENWSEEQYN